MSTRNLTPRTNILLALYDPNIDFLTKQLASLKNQDYSNYDVLIYDDCPEHPVDHLWIQQLLSPASVRFIPSDGVNLGYLGAFEKLIQASDGDFVAFCDQDDIWEPNKISSLVAAMEKDGSLLAICDYSVIDEADKVIHPSARRNGSSDRFYDNWTTGDDVVKYDIFTCLAPGMAMALRGDFARSIVPLSRNTGHDKWAIACAGIEGIVSYVPEVLAQYRRHGSNTTGALQDVDSKAEYIKERCMAHDALITELEERYGAFPGLEEAREFSHARLVGDAAGIRKHKELAPDQARFEELLAYVPSWAFKPMKWAIQKMTV